MLVPTASLGRLRKRNTEHAKCWRALLANLQSEVGVAGEFSKTDLALQSAEQRVSRRSGGSNLVEQVGVTIQQLEQLDQGQWRFGFAVLVARKGIDAAAKDFCGLTLIER